MGAAVAVVAEGMAWEVFGGAEATPGAMVVTAGAWVRILPVRRGFAQSRVPERRESVRQIPTVG